MMLNRHSFLPKMLYDRLNLENIKDEKVLKAIETIRQEAAELELAD